MRSSVRLLGRCWTWLWAIRPVRGSDGRLLQEVRATAAPRTDGVADGAATHAVALTGRPGARTADQRPAVHSGRSVDAGVAVWVSCWGRRGERRAAAGRPGR